MCRILSIVCLAIILSVSDAQVQLVNGTIKLTIGTTSGCGDTVRFIADLAPVYEKYKQFLELDFVPWGRTRRDENGNLICQFLERDCWANRLHRCVLNMLKGNQDAQMHYMSCEFNVPYPAFNSQSMVCAQSLGLSLIDVDYCMSTTGDELEGPAEAASIQPVAVINFIPFLIANDVIDVHQHNQLRTRLESVICFALADDPTTGVTHCQI